LPSGIFLSMHESLPPVCTRYHRAVELIGRRWAGAIIQALLAGPARFASSRDAIPEISDRMLSERLKELETEGIVTRHVHPDAPIRVEYELTDKGRDLQGALAAIGAWAERWLEPPAPPVRASA
jgi:DNA-binding HxlR family transcriptional regulator